MDVALTAKYQYKCRMKDDLPQLLNSIHKGTKQYED